MWTLPLYFKAAGIYKQNLDSLEDKYDVPIMAPPICRRINYYNSASTGNKKTSLISRK